MPIDDFITSTVIYASPPLGLPSLTIPLCVAILTTDQNTAWDAAYGASVDVVSLSPSTWSDALVALGVTAGEDIQVALTDMFSQRVDGQQSAPDEILLARRSTAVAQVWTATVAAYEAGNYTLTFSGISYTGLGASLAIIVPGNTDEPTTAGDIRTAVNASALPITASGAGADVVLTADEAGVPFILAVTHSVTPANITASITTANNGIGEDLAVWSAQDDRWFFVLETTRSSGVIQTAAEYIEALTRNRMGVFQTDDALAQSGASTDDLASVLGSAGLGLTRTALVWHDNDDQFVDWALVGKMSGFLPGDPNWVHQSLASVTGIDSPVLTDPTTLETKRYTFLETFGAPVPPQTSTRGGKMLDGNWIDIVHLVDDLNLRIQIREYQALLNGNVPYNGGEGTVGAALYGALSERAGPAGQAALVEGSIKVTVPTSTDQTDTNRLERRYAGVTWSALAQGKVNIISNVGYLEQ